MREIGRRIGRPHSFISRLMKWFAAGADCTTWMPFGGPQEAKARGQSNLKAMLRDNLPAVLEIISHLPAESRQALLAGLRDPGQMPGRAFGEFKIYPDDDVKFEPRTVQVDGGTGILTPKTITVEGHRGVLTPKTSKVEGPHHGVLTPQSFKRTRQGEPIDPPITKISLSQPTLEEIGQLRLVGGSANWVPGEGDATIIAAAVLNACYLFTRHLTHLNREALMKVYHSSGKKRRLCLEELEARLRRVIKTTQDVLNETQAALQEVSTVN
jgi:hypothetical protein